MVKEALLRVEAGEASEIERASLAEIKGDSAACEEVRGDDNPDWPQPTTAIHTNANPMPTARLLFNYAPSHLIHVNYAVAPEHL